MEGVIKVLTVTLLDGLGRSVGNGSEDRDDGKGELHGE
jgi:hypothetical protein